MLYGLIGVKCWINKRSDAGNGASSGRSGGSRTPRPRRDRSENNTRRDA